MKRASWIASATAVSAIVVAGLSMAPGAEAAAMHKGTMAKSPTVSVVYVDKTAQMVQAAPAASSVKDEATFVITAKLSNGKPAVGEPVAFYVGPMKPLSGIPPKGWYASGTKAGARYIASYSARTNAKGQARVVLLGQPADSMEMVGVRVGNLDSYSAKAGKALGSLDAWWTTAKSKPTAPIGDYVRVTPFMAVTAGMSAKEKLTIGVYDALGKPINGTHVSVIAKGSSKSSTSMGMSASSSMGMSSSSGLMLTTKMSGEVTTMIRVPSASAMEPVRIVVTQPSGKTRIAGGMNALVFASSK